MIYIWLGILFEQCQADGIYAKFVVLNLTCSILFSWFVSISSSLQMAIDWWNVQWVMICVFKSNNNICENMWWSNMFQTFLWISTQDNYFQIIHSSKKSGFSAAAVFINQFAHIPTFLICIIWLEEISGDFIFVI